MTLDITGKTAQREDREGLEEISEGSRGTSIIKECQEEVQYVYARNGLGLTL